jgi:thiol-disulfide isomerase/thioredoxin
MKSLVFLLFLAGMQVAEPLAYRLLIFEGSDWCANCRRLEKNILSDSLFLKQLAALSVEIEKVDFPQRKKLSPAIRRYNDSLAGKYAFDGSFPTLILTRTDVFRFQKIAYNNQTAEEMVHLLKAKTEALK